MSEQPSSPMPIKYQLFVGVDISAATFAVSTLRAEQEPEPARDFEQSPEGFTRFHNWLLTRGVSSEQVLIVLEATGTYWIMLATFLSQHALTVAVINPLQASNFVKSLPRRPKNDQIDAQSLARLAQAHKPAAWTPPPAIYHQLQQRLAQRANLMDLRQQVKNQLHALSVCPFIVEEVQRRMESLITTFSQQIKEVEKELEEVVKQDQEWAKSISLIQTIPGIGLLTASWVVVLTLNFTTCQKVESLTNYAGLAPMEYKSGSSVRGRPHIGNGGNHQLRTSLYMASLLASRFNPVIKAYYQKLRKSGKPIKVAYCACARKLLHIAFALVRSGKEFDAEYKVEVNQALGSGSVSLGQQVAVV